MENIISFFILNKYKLSDYFKQIKINQKKTMVKFESATDHIRITFLVYGEAQKKIIPFEDKVNRLFHAKENLSALDQLIAHIDLPYYFSFSPCVKISKENEPSVYTSQIKIIFEKR